MFVETFAEFCLRHGEYVDTRDGYRLFLNGASARKDELGRLLETREPLTGIPLLRSQRIYWTTKLDAERADWNSFFSTSVQQADNAAKFPDTCPPPRSDTLQQLEAGRVRIAALEHRIAEIDAELNNTPEAHDRRRREQEEAERRRKHAAHRDEIAAMNRGAVDAAEVQKALSALAAGQRAAQDQILSVVGMGR